MKSLCMVSGKKSVSDVADMTRTYQWLNESDIRANTAALIMTAQEQAFSTRAVAHEINHTVQEPKCRLCKQHAETVAHITSGCSKLAEADYTGRQNNVASIVYRAICAEYIFEHSKDWRVEQKKVVRNDHAKILWDCPIQTDKHLLHNRLDIVLINYKKQTGLIIDIEVPRCTKLQSKKTQKN